MSTSITFFRRESENMGQSIKSMENMIKVIEKNKAKGGQGGIQFEIDHFNDHVLNQVRDEIAPDFGFNYTDEFKKAYKKKGRDFSAAENFNDDFDQDAYDSVLHSYSNTSKEKAEAVPEGATIELLQGSITQARDVQAKVKEQLEASLHLTLFLIEQQDPKIIMNACQIFYDYCLHEIRMSTNE